MFKASFQSKTEGRVKVHRSPNNDRVCVECDGTYCEFEDSDALKLAEVLIRAANRREG